MISLLVCLGIRKGEFISLQVKDIDLEKRIITVRGETSKSRKTRFLPIHPTLLLHLRDYLAERSRWNRRTEYLIVSGREDRGLTEEGLKHWVDRMKEISGVKFHLHQFRHTFACKLDEKNVSAFKIQKLLGHTDIKMTMRYIRSIKTEDLGEDIEKISI